MRENPQINWDELKTFSKFSKKSSTQPVTRFGTPIYHVSYPQPFPARVPENIKSIQSQGFSVGSGWETLDKVASGAFSIVKGFFICLISLVLILAWYWSGGHPIVSILCVIFFFSYLASEIKNCFH